MSREIRGKEMIIFDISALANDEHRRHFIENPYSIEGESPDCNCSEVNRDFECPFDNWSSWKPKYQAYDDAADKDKPTPVMQVFQALFKHYENQKYQIWANRSEIERDQIEKWISEYTDVLLIYNSGGYNAVKLRPSGDTSPQEVLFEEWLDASIRENQIVDFVFSSHKKTIEMFRKRGVFVFDCNQEKE